MDKKQSSVTEVIVGFREIIPAQIFWASLENPKKYHIAKVINQATGEALAYLVKENDE